MEIKRLAVGELEGNCYLLVSDNELAVIDPGAEGERILKKINEFGADVKYIILTHCHPDHVLAVPVVKKITNAKVLIHEKEMRAFGGCEGDVFLKHESDISIGKVVLNVVHTPGHTPGGICLLSDNFVFTGDTLFENGYGRVDLPGGSGQQMKDSLQKLSQLLKPSIMVYPGHGEPFKFKQVYG